MTRTHWLCGCGNGCLSVPESEVPDYCGLCGAPVQGDDDDDDWAKEITNEAGMAHGVHAFNEARGYDTTAPDPCGHHCGSDCPRCGGDR